MASGECECIPRPKSQYIESLQPELLTELKNEIQRYEEYKGSLLHSYQGVSDMFGKICDILGKDDAVTTKITCEMEHEMMPIKHLMRDPIILVSGQVNSGKSSLINEILGNSLVPVEEIPCTSRIVRIRYSEENYYQIFDKDNKPKGERKSYVKKTEKETLKRQIKLRQSGSFEDKVHDPDSEETVEIGVNSDLLKSGIQIVDTPGMSENEALDRIVQECLDGVLQVLIYVIDANPSQREVDNKFLLYIRNKAPDMKILFACNKCDENEQARLIDAPSSSEESDEEDADETDGRPSQKREKLSKGEAVFRKLKTRGQINQDEKVETCDHFFQLSCTAIRHVRHKHCATPENQIFVDEFHRLITCTISHFQDCVTKHLENTVSTLYALATQAFDFFVSDKFLSQRAWTKFSAKMAETKKVEENVVKRIRNYIEDQRSHLYQSIEQIIDDRRDYIITKAANLDFLVKSGKKTWSSGMTKNYRQFLSTCLIHTLNQEIMNKGAVSGLLTTIDKEVQTSIRALFEECRTLSGVGDLLPQLESCYNIVLAAPATRSLGKHLVRKALHTRVVFALQKFAFEHFFAPAEENQRQWRKDTVKKLLDSVAINELGNVICDQFSAQINEAHDRFLGVLELIEEIHKRRRTEQRSLLTFIPSFSLMICKLRALKGDVVFGDKHVMINGLLTNDSNRSLIFDCQFGGKRAAARRVKCYDENLHEKFAELINYSRLLQLNHQNVLKVLDVYCDRVGIIYAIVPYMESNLFHMLCCDIEIARPALRDRLVMAHGIVRACEFLAERGFRVTDLRPNNVLLNNGIPVLNLLKWKAMEAPYPAPDGKPPFHWAPEVIQGTETQSKKTYDTYSCTILIWWLAMGEFVRPPFADSHDFKRISAFVVRKVGKVNKQLYEAFNDSKARKYATESEAMMLERVQKLLAENIQDGDDRMEIGVLQLKMKDLIRI